MQRICFEKQDKNLFAVKLKTLTVLCTKKELKVLFNNQLQSLELCGNVN